MSVAYVDTGAFIALIWSRDRDHGRVVDGYQRLRADGAQLVTCDPVIAETATRLRYDAGLASAQSFHEVVSGAVAAGGLVVRESDPGLRERAFGWMRRYDGLRLSYADCVGAAVATEVRADVVLGLDHDFAVMGFTLQP